MHSKAVRFLPFDTVWKMRIDHPYSLFVRDGDLLWSCGQCPLDGDGRVLHPNDLHVQAQEVAGFIRRFLGKMNSSGGSIARLVVYYVQSHTDDAERLRGHFHREFGDGVQVIPVAIPHFYYEGMLIEVDVFASELKSGHALHVDEKTGLRIETVNAGDLSWVSVTTTRAPPTATDAIAAMDRLLDKAGLTRAALLAEQWFVDGSWSPNLESVLIKPATGPTCDVVRVTAGNGQMLGALTFAPDPVVERTVAEEGVSLSFRKSRRHFHIKAFSTALGSGLVEQTSRIMRSVERLLREEQLFFEDVRKATTYYIAGSSAEELHDNMSVRNGYYAKPGPASTGLPVEGFPLSPALISISLFGAVVA